MKKVILILELVVIVACMLGDDEFGPPVKRFQQIPVPPGATFCPKTICH